MKQILVFGGTTEGREIAETLSGSFICHVSVATEYGEMLLDECPNLHILKGRLTQSQMEDLCRRNEYEAVIDATHPFATEVSENIRACAKNCGLPLVRLSRNVAVGKNSSCIFAETVEECEKILCNTEGKILLTTGSKDLAAFCKHEEIKRRLVVRVLPAVESLNICYQNGLEGKQIIAMQGPFSRQMNEIQIEDYGISVLVTKESGKTGGTDQKIAAALAKKITCIVIKNPAASKSRTAESGADYRELHSVDEVLVFLKSRFCEKTPVQVVPDNSVMVSLVGTGMGNAALLTVLAKTRIEQADCIFGAQRLLKVMSTSAKTYAYYTPDEIIPAIEKIQREQTPGKNGGCKKIAVLFSGDTGFYSGAAKLQNALKKMQNVRLEVIPGISSMSYLAAKLGIAYQDAEIISMHGVDKTLWLPKLEAALKNVSETEQSLKIFLLTSGTDDVLSLAKLVKELNGQNKKPRLSPDCKIGIGFNLSYPDEKTEILTLSDFAGITENDLSKGLYSVFIY